MVKLIMCVLSEIRRKGTVFIHRYGARVAIHVLLKKVFICDLLWHTREQVSWTQLHALLKKVYICDLLWHTREQVSWTQLHALLKEVYICNLLWHTREQVSWTQLHALLKKRYTFVTYCGTQWNKSPGHNYMLF